MFTLLLFVAVALSLISGSVWLFTITLSALLVTIYPVLLVLVVAGCGVFLVIQYMKR